MKKQVQFLLLLTLSFSLLAFSSDELPLYEGTAVYTFDKDQLDQVSKELEQLDAGYQTKLGKTYLQDRIELREEIKKALKTLNISSVIYENEFDIAGKEATFKIKPSIRSDRIVRLVSEGEANPDQTPGTYRTKYLVSTEVSVSTEAGLSVNLNENSDFNPRLNLFEAESGVKIQKISYVNSLREYLDNSQQDRDTLHKMLGSDSELKDTVQSDLELIQNGIKKIKYDNSHESKLGKLASKTTIDEEFRILLEGLFRDPKEIAKRFFKISANELKDDKILKPGEILVKTFYIRQTKPGFSLRNELTGELTARFKIDRDVFTVLRVGFQKDTSGKLFVKTQFEEYPRWEVEGSVSLFISALKILRAKYESSKLEANEKLFSFDLNQTYALAKLDSLFNRFGNPLRTKSEYETLLAGLESSDNSVEKILDRTRSSVGNFETFTTRFEIGLLGTRSQDVKRIERNNTNATNGQSSDEVAGLVEEANQFAVRLAKWFKSSEESTRRFRIFSRKNSDESLETDLAFEYYTRDSRTNEHEYENYINVIKTAFFLADHVKGTAAANMKQFLDERLASKKDNKNEQVVVANIYFSQAFVSKIMSKDVEHLKLLLAQMILGEGKTWANLEKISNTSRDMKDCSKAVKGPYANLIYRGASLTCTRVKAVAKSIVRTFIDAKSAGKNHAEVVRVFTQLVDNREVDQLVPFLMLQVGLIEKFDGDKAVYADISKAIENNEIEMNVSFLGEDIQGIQTLQLGDVPTLKPSVYANDFSLDLPLGSSKVIYTAQAFADNNNLYLKLSSVLNFNQDFQIVGVLFEGTKPVALIKVDELFPASTHKEQNSSEFDYILKFPFVSDIKRGTRYALATYVVAKETGKRISEPVEVRFKLD